MIPDKAIEAVARAIAPYSDDDDWEYNTSAAEDAIKAAAPFIRAEALDAFDEYLRNGMENAKNGGERQLHEDARIMLDGYRGQQ